MRRRVPGGGGRLARRMGRRIVVGIALALVIAGRAAWAQDVPGRPYLPIGLFFASVEEGARIFTPVRLLPLDDPESLGHDFPTLQQLAGTEFQSLLWLGSQAGLRLWATLERYPREPTPAWPYRAYRQPPDSAQLRAARIEHRPKNAAPLPGLRAVLYSGGALMSFIVDTRGLTLAERGMRSPTSMGLDIGRGAFLAALGRASALVPASGLRAVIFDR